MEFWNHSVCNYFFEQAVPKFDQGMVAGVADDIRHYIGEMHFCELLLILIA